MGAVVPPPSVDVDVDLVGDLHFRGLASETELIAEDEEKDENDDDEQNDGENAAAAAAPIGLDHGRVFNWITIIGHDYAP